MKTSNKPVYKFVRISFTVLVIVFIIYLAARVGTYCYDMGYRVFTEPAMEEEPGRDIVVQVQDSMSEKDIASMLEEKGLVRDADLFYLQLKLSIYKGELNPGIYTLNTSMTPKELMAAMAVEEEEESETEEATESVEESTEGLMTTEGVQVEGVIDGYDEETGDVDANTVEGAE